LSYNCSSVDSSSRRKRSWEFKVRSNENKKNTDFFKPSFLPPFIPYWQRIHMHIGRHCRCAMYVGRNIVKRRSPTPSSSSMVRFNSLPRYNHDPSFRTPVCVSWGQFVVSVLQCMMYCTGSTQITPPFLLTTLLTCVRSSSMFASTLKVKWYSFCMFICLLF